MEVSLGIYTLVFILFFLIIPGFLARRFYYSGEFSKQINLSTNPTINLVYSFFVGVILSLCFVALLKFLANKDIDIDEILRKFDSNFINPDVKSNQTDKFDGISKTIYSKYLPFIGGVYIFSAVIGLAISKLVLFFGWDTKLKFFRFGNDWHYLFSGKILKFKQHLTSDHDHNLKVKYTYLDILVSEKGDETTLYSGFFADYDICPKDISRLEKVHLLKAIRYKKTENGVVTRNIPGNLFTIMAEKILNINCTYVCFNEDETKFKKFLIHKRILVPIQILTTLVFVLSTICIVFSLRITDNYYFNLLLNQSFIYKLGIIFLLNLVIGLITPFKINSEYRAINFIGWDKYFSKIFVIIIIVLCYLALPHIITFFSHLMQSITKYLQSYL